jgi:putative hydrolase of the HAD superfamily
MIKAIFFDWFNTLAHYKPLREEVHSQVLDEFGIEISTAKLIPALQVADKYILGEKAIRPVEKRNHEERVKVYLNYNNIMFAEAGINVSKELHLKILRREQQLFEKITFVLFDDVLPTLRLLKERGFIQGLITNASENIISVYNKLGLEPYLDLVVTSEEVGVDKPEPAIFLAALERAKVINSEAIHVGDQYDSDVAGAIATGITPILVDRSNFYSEINDCHRIHSLIEVIEYL